jgi:hypothetical protein
MERERERKHSEAVSVLPMCDRRALIITTTNATPIYTTLAIIPANPPHTMRRLMSVAEDVFVVVVVNGVVLFIVPLIFYHNIYNIIYVMGAMTMPSSMLLEAMR